MDSLMSHSTEYLYLHIGTNLNPISPPQKSFSQSLRSTSFESSVLLISVSEIWIEEVQVFGREQHVINLTALLEKFTHSREENYHGSWGTQRGKQNKATQLDKNCLKSWQETVVD